MRRFIIHAAAALALAVPAALHAQGVASNDMPVCRATMSTGALTTVVQFRDGYRVEGPWRITQNHAAAMDDGAKGIEVGAVLDHIVEVDALTGERDATPIPSPVMVTFQGHDQQELISQAAHIWCMSVLKARGDDPGAAATTARLPLHRAD